jgi:hypothetical protein
MENDSDIESESSNSELIHSSIQGEDPIVIEGKKVLTYFSMTNKKSTRGGFD